MIPNRFCLSLSGRSGSRKMGSRITSNNYLLSSTWLSLPLPLPLVFMTFVSLCSWTSLHIFYCTSPIFVVEIPPTLLLLPTPIVAFTSLLGLHLKSPVFVVAILFCSTLIPGPVLLRLGLFHRSNLASLGFWLNHPSLPGLRLESLLLSIPGNALTARVDTTSDFPDIGFLAEVCCRISRLSAGNWQSSLYQGVLCPRRRLIVRDSEPFCVGKKYLKRKKT